MVAKFTVAVNINYKDKDGNRPADFIPCEAFGKTADGESTATNTEIERPSKPAAAKKPTPKKPTIKKPAAAK